jgi:hypothetical protein
LINQKDYFKRKKPVNKKEAEEFILKYYPLLLKRIISYPGKLDDIFEPKDDKTYYLLKSCLFPLLEMITWLSPQNRGYNQTVVNYVFFHDDFMKKPQPIYIFKDINSTKTKFMKLEFNEAINHFKTRIINPYGVLFDKHDDNLAYDVELLIEALGKRRVVKNQMLILEALDEHFDKVKEYLSYFNDLIDYKLSKEQANNILEVIGDPLEIREKRIQSLCEIEFEGFNDLHKFIKLRASQLNVVQLGIKVAANSAYGIFGLITWPFASPLIGNAITNAGKIYGIKLFQAVSVDILNNYQSNKEIKNEQ